MTLAEATKEFESQFAEVRSGYETAALSDGTPFISVCPGGAKEIGDPTPVVAVSEDIAAKLWLMAAREIAGDKKILHWRVEPEGQFNYSRWCEEDGSDFEHLKGFPVASSINKYYCVYSRFAVTDL